MTTYRSGVPFKLAKPRATNPYHREARPDALAFWTWAAGPSAPPGHALVIRPDGTRETVAREVILGEGIPEGCEVWMRPTEGVTVSSTASTVPDAWATKSPAEVLADLKAVVDALRAEQEPRDIAAEMLSEFRRLYPAAYETWLREAQNHGA